VGGNHFHTYMITHGVLRWALCALLGRAPANPCDIFSES
jgi:hypothetical protein